MKHPENWSWRINVKITVRQNGIITLQRKLHNVITRGALTLARDSIRGQATLEILQVGVGAGADPVSDEDTLLQDERLRVEILRRDPVGIDGLLTTAYVAPEQANDFVINEIGWFGEGATESVDTGTLMSRVLFNHDKNTLESIQIDRLDTFAEAP